jgi:hypothetical protein
MNEIVQQESKYNHKAHPWRTGASRTSRQVRLAKLKRLLKLHRFSAGYR